MVRTLVVLLAVLAAGYWYWSSQGEAEVQVAEQEKLEKNARRMRECLNREASMNSVAGISNVKGVTGTARERCAEKLGLYSAEGEWRELGVYEESAWD